MSARPDKGAAGAKAAQPAGRFWDMSEQAVQRFIEERGLEAWKRKVAEDRQHTGELAAWPNPWLPGRENVRRQNIVASLAPDLAARQQREAEGAH
jgi:hypothetical protein